MVQFFLYSFMNLILKFLEVFSMNLLVLWIQLYKVKYLLIYFLN